MITLEKIQKHLEQYPTFDAKRLIEWLNKEPTRWQRFANVSKANLRRRKYEKFAAWAASMD